MLWEIYLYSLHAQVPQLCCWVSSPALTCGRLTKEYKQDKPPNEPVGSSPRMPKYSRQTYRCVQSHQQCICRSYTLSWHKGVIPQQPISINPHPIINIFSPVSHFHSPTTSTTPSLSSPGHAPSPAIKTSQLTRAFTLIHSQDLSLRLLSNVGLKGEKREVQDGVGELGLVCLGVGQRCLD